MNDTYRQLMKASSQLNTYATINTLPDQNNIKIKRAPKKYYTPIKMGGPQPAYKMKSEIKVFKNQNKQKADPVLQQTRL